MKNKDLENWGKELNKDYRKCIDEKPLNYFSKTFFLFGTSIGTLEKKLKELEKEKERKKNVIEICQKCENHIENRPVVGYEDRGDYTDYVGMIMRCKDKKELAEKFKLEKEEKIIDIKNKILDIQLKDQIQMEIN